MFKFLSLISAYFIFLSCSTVNKVAVRATGGVIESGSEELLTEANWHNFNQSTVANLKLIESLWYTDQSNESLLTLLIKGYSAYAFAASETLALKDIVLDEDESFYKEQAILNYEKAVYYGFKYLKEQDIYQKDFYAKDFSEKMMALFNDELDEDDYVAIFYFAQALGGSINLQRDDVTKMGHFNLVKKMIDWVCDKDPSIEYGSCGLFKAVIESSTPTMLGGSPERAKKMFQDLMKKTPYNLLSQLSYIQYSVIPSLEEEEFEDEMSKLKIKLDTWYSLQRGAKGEHLKNYKRNRVYNLFNSVARKRYNIINKIKNEIF